MEPLSAPEKENRTLNRMLILFLALATIAIVAYNVYKPMTPVDESGHPVIHRQAEQRPANRDH